MPEVTAAVVVRMITLGTNTRPNKIELLLAEFVFLLDIAAILSPKMREKAKWTS